MKSIGIFGGSFNPVHNGHLNLALNAKKELGLDKVIFVPANIPPHKSSRELAANDIRLEMCRLAVSGHDDLEVSDFEMTQTSKSYSIYTVLHFRQMYPDDTLYLLIGSDMLFSFDTWYRYQDILKNVRLAVMSRENGENDRLRKKTQELQQYGKVHIIGSPPYPVSSTEIRSKIKNREKYSCYLAEKVVQYITLMNLYTD
ncbi:MAG: nicotinate (nicotinamide) nucleotide adenylyltransferase [Oscillospiraceae bacterium]|nr:nicotinate (nicotinamide) nucleotide adenylyltransferase [Oscillospiraceae bacterium]